MPGCSAPASRSTARLPSRRGQDAALPDPTAAGCLLARECTLSEAVYFDVAYTYIKLANNSVQKTDGGVGTEKPPRNLSANYQGSVQIFAAQIRWTF